MSTTGPAQDKLENWLHRQLYAGGCKRIMIKNAASTKDAIQTFEIQNDELGEGFVGTLATEIQTIISDDAEGLGGRNRYYVYAVDVRGSVIARHVMQCFVEDEDFSPTEDIGMVLKTSLGQQMRHNEMMFKYTLTTVGSVLNMLKETIESQNDRLRHHDEQFDSILKLKEELLDRQHERAMELEEHSRSSNLKEEAFDKLKLLVPALLERFFSKGKPTSSLSNLALKEFLSSMSAEQIEHFTKGLTPEQILALDSLAGGLVNKNGV